MNITHQSTDMEVTHAMRSEMQNTLERTLFQFSTEISSIDVTYRRDGHKFEVSASVHTTSGPYFHVRETASDMYNGMGKAADAIFDVLYKKRDINKDHSTERKATSAYKRQELTSTRTQDDISTVLVLDSILDDIPVRSTRVIEDVTPSHSSSSYGSNSSHSSHSRHDDHSSWNDSSSSSSWNSSHESSSSWSSSDSGSSWSD